MATGAGRLLDFHESDNFSPINGIGKSPTMTLADAVTFAQVRTPAFQGENFDAGVFLATRFARQHKDPGTLNKEEIAAIHFYTQESVFYAVMNQLMRERNREPLKSLFPYLKLFLGALHKLDLQQTPQPVYRGVTKQIYSSKNKGDEIILWAFSSATASIGVLNNPAFLGQTGERTILAIQTRCFVDIRKFSNYNDLEDERLILPGTFLAIKDVLDLGAGLQMIQMVDEASPPLMDFFHPQLCAAKTSPSLVNSFGNMVVAPHGRLAAPGGTSPAIPMQLDEHGDPVSTKASKPLFAPLSLKSPDSLAKAALTIIPPTKGSNPLQAILPSAVKTVALPLSEPAYICQNCKSVIAKKGAYYSSGTMGKNQPALFFKSWEMSSVKMAERREQNLSTSRYIIQDMLCKKCSVNLGWIYIWAENAAYKDRENTCVLYQECLILKD